jgi:acyl-CoA synthetase (AMP-forming)/AMP-acid ligase II
VSTSTSAAGPVRAATWNDAFLDHWHESAEPALLTSTGTWSGRELIERASGAARWLDAIGVAEGAAVPALLDESPLAIALTVGAALSGRALAPLGTRLPAADLVAAVRVLGAAHIVAEPGTASIAADVERGCGAEVHLLADAAPEPLPNLEPRSSDVMLIMHTSGTEGRPKPVPVQHDAMVARLTAYGDALELRAGDRYCSASPFHHTAGVGMALTALGVGAAVIPQAWFSIGGWREAGRLGVSCALLVPTMIDMLLAESALAAATPRVLQYGAAPIHVETLRAALAALPDTRFVQIFGQTEMSPITVLTHADHMRGLDGDPELLATVGRAAPGVELHIEHPDDDGVGEVVVRAAHAFVVDGDGVRRSGDLGSVDAAGYVRLRGRRNDRIVRGGENIYPVEVEHALLSHAGVREVAVVGIPDRRFGELVKAVIVPTDTQNPPSVAALVAHARAHVAPFKVPTVVEFADELPRNASGKVLRRSLTGA